MDALPKVSAKKMSAISTIPIIVRPVHSRIWQQRPAVMLYAPLVMEITITPVMATENRDNHINRPQEITAPKPATTYLDHSIPDVSGWGDSDDPEAGEKIQVSSIHTVNIQGQLDDGLMIKTQYVIGNAP